MPGEVRYARSGDVNVAYRVTGDGSPDIVQVPAWVLSFDSYTELPAAMRSRDRLTSMGRLIEFDRRGIGLSDRVSGVATLEERADDLRAVLDAVGSERAHLVGYMDGTIETTMFAALYPDRTNSLVFYGPFNAPPDPAYREGGVTDVIIRHINESWGQASLLALVAPSMVDDPDFRDWYARAERSGATPATAAAHMRFILGLDISEVTRTLRHPALVLNRSDAPVMPTREICEWVANHIVGARYVELPGVDGFPFLGEADAVFDEIEEFITGVVLPRTPTACLRLCS